VIEILLILYGLAVWLVFFKFKILPWNTTSMVIVITIPIIGAIALILLINVFQPVSTDVRVLRHVVQVVPRVPGRVIEVPVDGSKLVKQGEVLFRIDPSEYQIEVDRLKAAVAEAEGNARALDEQLASALAKVKVAQSRVGAAKGRIDAVDAKAAAVQARLDLSELRVKQNRSLTETGAGNRFDLERHESEVAQYKAEHAAALAERSTSLSEEASALADLNASQAEAAQVRAKLSAVVNGEQAPVAEMRAQLADAEWRLEQTVMRAPADGYPVNLQLRPGSYVSPVPMAPVMSFVEDSGVVVATYLQNALHRWSPVTRPSSCSSTIPDAFSRRRCTRSPDPPDRDSCRSLE
jgi:multidrug resistance efflux pump